MTGVQTCALPICDDGKRFWGSLNQAIDPKELAAGQAEEMEHTRDPKAARGIALDHLRENPKYYSKLDDAGLLGPEGQKLLRSSRLNQSTDSWFSGSKVVDDDGSPLVVYHGSSADFDTFDESKIRDPLGFFFSATPSGAKTFGQPKAYNLCLRNPLVVTQGEDYKKNLSGKDRFDLMEEGYDGVVIHYSWATDYVAFLPEQIASAPVAVTSGRFQKALHQMAYPVAFSFDELKAQRSYAAKLRYCETHLQKLGSGSSRTVYQVDDEKVLKMAKNPKGLAQNQTESDWGMQSSGIVAKVFDSDDEGAFLEMELAQPATAGAFRKLAGFDIKDLDKALRSESLRLKPNKYLHDLPEDAAMAKRLWEESEFFNELVSLAVNFGMPIPGDFTRLSSWGVVQREGSPSLVLIDFGLNDDTFDEHYSPAKKKAAPRW